MAINFNNRLFLLLLLVIVAIAVPIIISNINHDSQNNSSKLSVMKNFTKVSADEQTKTIVDNANSFIASLGEEQREKIMYDFSDNTQRFNWSNLPDGPVKRGGLKLLDLNNAQREYLNILLASFLSEYGYNNIRHQLIAEDMLPKEDGPNFGSDYYYVSFLGAPSNDLPWMFQFGGHHLAINATVYGPDISFSPMMTGGQPLKISDNDEEVYITNRETDAAHSLMEHLNDDQKKIAIRSSKLSNLHLGPGEFGSTVEPEGVKGSNLNAKQRELLIDLIAARLSYINEDDFNAKMTSVKDQIMDTYFGWWGPVDVKGAAYFRILSPSLVIEYAPQTNDGDPTNHAHNIYRDLQNDYGMARISNQRP